jgi:hypothetical protein
MGRIEQAVIFPVLERRRKIEDIERTRQILQGIVKIGCFFSVIENNKMIELAACIVEKSSGGNKFGRTSNQVLKVYLLGLGKRKPVRQLKKAGVILKSLQQILHHNSRLQR